MLKRKTVLTYLSPEIPRLENRIEDVFSQQNSARAFMSRFDFLDNKNLTLARSEVSKCSSFRDFGIAQVATKQSLPPILLYTFLIRWCAIVSLLHLVHPITAGALDRQTTKLLRLREPFC